MVISSLRRYVHHDHGKSRPSRSERPHHLVDGTGNQLKSNTTNGNGQVGINGGGGGGHTIKDNTTNGNGVLGIIIPGGSVGNSVKGNTAQGNVIVDLIDDNANCDNNVWLNNTFNTSKSTLHPVGMPDHPPRPL